MQACKTAECCASAGIRHVHGDAGDDSGVSALLRAPAQPAAAAGHCHGLHLPCPVLCQPGSAPGDWQGAAAAQVRVTCCQPRDEASPTVSCTWGLERDSSIQAIAWGCTQTQLTQSSYATAPKSGLYTEQCRAQGGERLEHCRPVSRILQRLWVALCRHHARHAAAP